MNLRSIAISAIALMITALPSSARVDRVGIYNSVKGMGLSMQFSSSSNHSSFKTLTLSADTFGLVEGELSYPGFKVSYSNNIVLDVLEAADTKIYVYCAAGVSAGYVRDFGYALGEHMPMAALTGTVGFFFHFPRKVDISLSLCGEAGFTANEYFNSFRWYTNGISRLLHPDLTVYYKF